MELWLSFIYAWYNGAMVVALTEVVPVNVRTAGFSLAYSLATTLGGSSLAISTWLIETTQVRPPPATGWVLPVSAALWPPSSSIARAARRRKARALEHFQERCSCGFPSGNA